MSLDISKILLKLAEQRDKTFIYQGQPISLEQVFSMSGGLPILAKRANLLADFLFGESLKVYYRDDPESLTGERLEIDPEQHAFVLLMLLFDVVEEIFVNAGDAQEVTLS